MSDYDSKTVRIAEDMFLNMLYEREGFDAAMPTFKHTLLRNKRLLNSALSVVNIAKHLQSDEELWTELADFALQEEEREDLPKESYDLDIGVFSIETAQPVPISSQDCVQVMTEEQLLDMCANPEALESWIGLPGFIELITSHKNIAKSIYRKPVLVNIVMHMGYYQTLHGALFPQKMIRKEEACANAAEQRAFNHQKLPRLKSSPETCVDRKCQMASQHQIQKKFGRGSSIVGSGIAISGASNVGKVVLQDEYNEEEYYSDLEDATDRMKNFEFKDNEHHEEHGDYSSYARKGVAVSGSPQIPGGIFVTRPAVRGRSVRGMKK